MGLADPVHALDRRFGVLCGRLPAHVPQPDVRQPPQAARAGLAVRLRDLPGADGRGLHGLPAAMGPDVVLGRAGHHQPVLRHPVRRSRHRTADPWRLCRGRCDAESLLRVPRDRGPVGAARSGGGAHFRAARRGVEQPRRYRDQGARRAPRCERPSARWHSVPPVLQRSRRLRDRGVPAGVLGDPLLRARGRRLLPRIQQFHPGRSLSRPRCTSLRCGTSRPSIRCCARSQAR